MKRNARKLPPPPLDEDSARRLANELEPLPPAAPVRQALLERILARTVDLLRGVWRPPDA